MGEGIPTRSREVRKDGHGQMGQMDRWTAPWRAEWLVYIIFRQGRREAAT